MRTLITADLHLTDSERDSYRWDVFSALGKIIADEDIDRLIILGDLTERKDNHSSQLTNKITEELLYLSQRCPVVVLMGNHDYKDSDKPYFKFLDSFPNISFISKIQKSTDYELFLPHTFTPKEDWKDTDFTDCNTIFLHQTLSGTEADNGHILENDAKLPKRLKATVIGGDIHKPQDIYVGAPHAVDFGDIHDGQFLILENGELSKIGYPGVKKWHLEVESPEEIQEYDMRAGDQCKVTLWLAKEDYYKNDDYKKEITNLCKHVRLFGITTKIIPSDVQRVSEENKTVLKKESSKEVLDRFISSDTIDIDKEYIKKGREVFDGIQRNQV